MNPRVLNQGKDRALSPGPLAQHPPRYSGRSVNVSLLRTPELTLPTLAPQKPPTPPNAFAPDSPLRLHPHSPTTSLGFHSRLRYRDPREMREGGVASGGRWLRVRDRQGSGIDSHPASQGRFPLSPWMDCCTSRILALEPDSARPVGDSPGHCTKWPGRHCPLLEIMCNYNLPAHNGIRILTWGRAAL